MFLRTLKRAVGYLRRSTNKQDKSLEDQRAEIQRYANEHGYELLYFFEDDAVSGTSVNGRTGFQDMINTATHSNGQPPFDAIIVWDVKRFSRGDNDEVGHYRWLLKQHGVEVKYVAENLRGDDSDDFVLPIKQTLARQESKDKSRDVIRGQVPRIQRGYSSPGHPYGYYRQVVGPDGQIRETLKRGEKRGKRPDDRVKFVIGEPKEVAIVRRIFDYYVNRGMGKWSIARALNTEGVPPPRAPRSTRWGTCAVDFILKNHAYIGWLVYNKTSKGKFHRIIKAGDQFTPQERRGFDAGKMERHAETEWVISKGAHEALVDENIFWKAQTVRKERATTGYPRGRAMVSPYLWTGLIYCQRCERRMCGYTQRGAKHKWYYYQCPSCLVTPGTKRTPVPATALDAYIVERIQHRLQQPERLTAIVQALEQTLTSHYGNTAMQRDSIEGELREISAQVNRLLNTIDERHKDLLNNKLDELQRTRETLEAQRERLQRQPQPVHVNQLAQELVGYAKNFHRVFAQGSMSERKMFVRAYVERIIVNPQRREATVGLYRIPHLPSFVELPSQVLVSSGSK